MSTFLLSIGTKKEKVYLSVHLFLLLFATSSSLAQSDIPKVLVPAYQIALHHHNDLWPVVKLETLDRSLWPHAIYINALAATMGQFFGGEPMPIAQVDEWIKILKEEPSDDYATFYLGEVYLLRSLAYFSQGMELKAFFDFRNAYKLAQALHKKSPNFLPALKTNGVLEVMLGAVPDKYAWLITLLGYKGDINSGMDKLTKLATAGNSFSLEAKIWKVVFSQYLLDSSSFDDIALLYQQNSQSQLLRLLYNGVALKNNKSALVLANISPSTIPNIYAQLGESYLNRLETDSALVHFNYFLAKTDQKASPEMHYKIWIAHSLKGDTLNAEVYREKLASMQKPLNEADAYAIYVASNEPLPHASITMLRLTIDGGYFKIAKEILTQFDGYKFGSPKDQLEFTYRKARYHQLTGNTPLANLYFHQVIRNAGQNNWYFIPNAVYQMGNIYMANKEYDLAKRYLKMVLSYAGYPYEGSLKKKAAIKLKQLEN